MKHKNNFSDVQDVKRHTTVMLNVKKNIGLNIKSLAQEHNKINQHKMIKTVKYQQMQTHKINKNLKMSFMA